LIFHAIAVLIIWTEKQTKGLNEKILIFLNLYFVKFFDEDKKEKIKHNWQLRHQSHFFS